MSTAADPNWMRSVERSTRLRDCEVIVTLPERPAFRRSLRKAGKARCRGKFRSGYIPVA
ncbi:hypothetical protein RB6342 [Rhodopirellula baltica SH 1]|uniref:Uncharacterized protein n=2 Tax=Rhodopirellula baltica TaxID=265606 RepID=Q7UQG3_RHOBA|nr:hypothetical protein RB6342 [Rhodopirellula baltica SH 1]